jgi:hypothetical protein
MPPDKAFAQIARYQPLLTDLHTERNKLQAMAGAKRVAIKTLPHMPNGVLHPPFRTPAKQRSGRMSPAKPSNASTNGAFSDRTSSVASGPRKLSNVNGMVKRFDHTNGTIKRHKPSSIADNSDISNRPPPKLKRKAPD